MFWPPPLERQQMMSETAHELPFCFGYVDGTEVALAEKPTQDPEAFFSRKQQYSLKVQAVCDHKLRIRHLITGYPGSVHDARIYNNSDLALNPGNYFSGDEWIAGDSAYKLTPTVITPFRRNASGSTPRIRNQFNRTFGAFRVRIENCFMHLKEKFNSLKQLKIAIKDNSSIKKACIWIMVCAILHNIALEEEPIAELPTASVSAANVVDANEYDQNIRSSSEGEAKRQAIIHLMNL